MTAQEAVNKIVCHLLGKNWYSYYTNNEDINDEIVETYADGIKVKTKTLLINGEENTSGAVSVSTWNILIIRVVQALFSAKQKQNWLISKYRDRSAYCLN